jgi:hypothetical protein
MYLHMRARQALENIVGGLEDFAEWRKYGDRRFSEDKGKRSNRYYDSADLLVVDLFFSKMLSYFRYRPACASCACYFHGLGLAQSCLTGSQGLVKYGESSGFLPAHSTESLARQCKTDEIRFISERIDVENSPC